MKKEVKIIAFHLPQFHEIEENNEWWGEGFTEWTNVKRGKKMYPGHYQPRIPLNNNYYDLSDPTVLLNQAQLAKKYGIYGFCFYHYYFTGKKLLEKPVEQYFNAKDKIPYCFAWANQSFTRTWYGKNGSNEMLLRQVYGGEKQWKDHFDYLLPFFKDDKYIKVNNKPMFLIYLSQDFRKCSKMIDLWNELALRNGLSGIHFVAMDTVYEADWFPMKIDATVDFEPMRSMRDVPTWVKIIRDNRKRKFLPKGASGNVWKDSLYVDNICSYEMITKLSINRKHAHNIKVNYLGAFTGWDNTARKDESGLVIRNSSPEKFKKYLRTQILRSQELDNPFLFINAWNEWSEGAYLEPDNRYGYAYLRAVREVIDEMR